MVDGYNRRTTDLMDVGNKTFSGRLRLFLPRIPAASPPYSALGITVQSCDAETCLFSIWAAAISLENAKQLYEKRDKGSTEE